MKTKKLKYIPDFNFILIGVSSTDDDYKFSWQISELLVLEFGRCKDLEIIDPRFSEFLLFSTYETINTTDDKRIRIISNKGKEGFLIDELKNIDFFVMIYDFENIDFVDSLIGKLKSLNSISAVFKIDPVTLKSREKL